MYQVRREKGEKGKQEMGGDVPAPMACWVWAWGVPQRAEAGSPAGNRLKAQGELLLADLC